MTSKFLQVIGAKVSKKKAPAAARKPGAAKTIPKDQCPEDEIWFYGKGNSWGEFSNFYPAPFTLQGKEWPTSEHYFQAQKFQPHMEHVEAVRAAKTPGGAAKLGRSRQRPFRGAAEWEEIKQGVMMDALRAKFGSHEHLKSVLLSTGDKKLVEHTKNDRYWADGGDGRGKNILGILLMKLRDELRSASAPEAQQETESQQPSEAAVQNS